ncbi:M48 family metallopeptidase [Myxococcus sp. RHSTA-1-4]|uniref:M48 family metallopeptidase n=1 Tax=Myxococcus sp. RHSTA-1-4 TaxID=2874601 RepID=UPI001CBCFFD5|nr:M48 family metallopeptidase [Myxococcus sp. RHSTA-1-4]MBZ4416891.1 M48 family metallopeptidase [Myxococcus sp. RHSTA-1-4]
MSASPADPQGYDSPALRAELVATLWPDADKVPARLLECRHCGRRNRVRVSAAVLDAASCECGACGKALFIPPDAPLTNISSMAYEHPLDRATLVALKALPGFSTVMRWVLSNVGERSMRLMNLSTSVRCGEDQFPELVALLDLARLRLDIPYQPSLFLSESPYANAATFGVEEPTVMVHASLLDHLDDPQVVAVLAHELGHLHADHVLYRSLAVVLAGGSQMLGSVGRLLSFPLQKALYKWMRCSELTADRAGLLGCRDVAASLGVLMRLAGGHRPGTVNRTKMRLAPFVRQARELAKLEESSWFDGLLATLMTMDSSHPFIAWRVMHLLDWVENGNYLDILAGHYDRVKRPVAA